MIRKIVEGKLRHNKKQLQKFIGVGNKAAIRDYEVRCHILEDILEDTDEANEGQKSYSNCNKQHVSQQRELLLAFAKHIEKAGYDGSCLTYEQELDEFLKANNCT